MLTYAQFIDEIKPLRAQIEGLRQEPGLANSVAFKKSSHALLMLVRAVKSMGYRSTGCYIEGRIFTQHNPWSSRDAATYFNAELDDTVVELDDLISHFEKYGDPKPLPPAVAAPLAEELLAAPEASACSTPWKLARGGLRMHAFSVRAVANHTAAGVVSPLARSSRT